MADDTDGSNKSNNEWTVSRVCIIIALFLLAGLLEIGGGWFIWIYVRGRSGWPNNGHTWWVVMIGCIMLIAYGFAPTIQPLEDFGRIYAAYGGIFIALSFLWAYLLDGFVPDKGDIIGALIALIGVSVILFWPR